VFFQHHSSTIAGVIYIERVLSDTVIPAKSLP
jgi:hypothetical protein